MADFVPVVGRATAHHNGGACDFAVGGPVRDPLVNPLAAQPQFPNDGGGSPPEYLITYRWLAAALGQLGRSAEARDALTRAIVAAPASFDLYVRNRVPWMSPNDHGHMVDGLRKAGWMG